MYLTKTIFCVEEIMIEIFLEYQTSDANTPINYLCRHDNHWRHLSTSLSLLLRLVEGRNLTISGKKIATKNSDQSKYSDQNNEFGLHLAKLVIKIGPSVESISER